MNATEELNQIVERLEKLAQRGDIAAIVGPLSALKKSAEEVGKSASGSWLGYQASVYYEGFVRPPPGAHFDHEWGWQGIVVDKTSGSWEEYPHEIVVDAIYRNAENPDLIAARKFDDNAKEMIETCRSDALSVLQIHVGNDDYFESVKRKIDEISLRSPEDEVRTLAPRHPVYTRDNVAFDRGKQTPPHIEVLAEILAIRHTRKTIGDLTKLVKEAASHLMRRQQAVLPLKSNMGTKVFIAHGHSPAWRELKDYLKERLKVQTEEFNSEPTAGTMTFERLEQMLRSAAVAFLVMTAEDEQKDGSFHPRLNVVHEAGLFQGRLGPKRAIILMEKGCKEFSNIAGLVQIRFQSDDIKSTFDQIRQTLEQAGLVPPVR